MTVTSVRSFCRLCTAICGIVVDVDGDQVLRVRGDHDHPLSHGYTCAKGRALPQFHHHPDRIERPLRRVDGALVACSWDDCLDDLATRLRAIIDEHGPSAVGIYFGSGVGMDAAGYRMEEALHRAIGTPAKFSPLTIDGTAKALVAHLVGGFVGLSPHVDMERARLVLFVGTNPVVSHGHGAALPDPVSAIRRVRANGEVWVLDPLVTETARLATGHLAPRPGTDHAVLAHLLRELLHDGADRAVLEQRCRQVAELAAAVEPFTATRAAELAGVEPEELAALLAAVRRAGSVAVHTGTGVTMAESANVTTWLSWALMIVTGAMNRPGGVWFHPGFGHQFEAFDLPVAPPDALFGPGPASRPDVQSFLGEWPGAALADEIDAGTIKAFLNFGGSLVASFPDTTSLVPALESLDVLATIEIVANETTALSTHVLPTKGQLEREDVTLWDFLVPAVSAQHTPAVVEPVGERRSAWWVLAELGRRLGHDLADASATDEQMLGRIMARARRPFTDVKAAGYVELTHELPAPWVERHLDRAGGWHLAPPLLVAQLAEISATPAANPPLVLTPRRQMRRLNSTLEFLGEPAEVLLHPDSAAAAGVAGGDRITVRTERGSLDGIAKVDPAIRPGVVSVPHGHRSANVNRLTDRARIDGPTGMVLYGGFAVEVGPAAPAHVATVRNGQPGLDGEAVHEHRGEPGRER